MGYSTLQISRWLQLSDLCVFEVNGNCLFPLMASSGCISARYVAYLAKKLSDFPEPDQAMGSKAGLSENGKFYRIDFSGNHEYTREEVNALLAGAEKALA